MKIFKTFESFLEEGVNDPGILKAFFMAGGPGSGKSYVAGDLFGLPKDSSASVSYDLGLKLVNSDAAFELLLKKANIDMAQLMDIKDKDPAAWQDAMQIRDKAKKISKGTQKMYIEGRLGMVIDGTGKNYKKIEGQVKELVAKMWQEVQDNLGRFQRLFKAKRFEIVDNSKYGDSEPTDLVGKEIRKFMGQPVSNSIGKHWIWDQKNSRK